MNTCHTPHSCLLLLDPISSLCLQWAADLLKASVLEDAAKLTQVLKASTSCLTGDCATDAAKSFVAITASVASLKVCWHDYSGTPRLHTVNADAPAL
jgi:hypothetical protein